MSVSGQPEATFTVQHGLYYVDRFRHNATLYRLDGDTLPDIPRPDRDICRALLRYALDRLDAQETS